MSLFVVVFAHRYAPAPRVGGLSDDAHLMSVCQSGAHIGPKSRTDRPRKTKIGTGVAHVTRDSDTTFKVKRSEVNLQEAGTYCGGLPHILLNTIFIFKPKISKSILTILEMNRDFNDDVGGESS